MRILFFHTNGIVPTAGGISRITSNLAHLYREKGHEVWFLGAKNQHQGFLFDEQQFFLPSSERVDCKVNRSYLCDLLKSLHIDIVLNQVPFSEEVIRLLNSIRSEIGVKLVSCYHNSILTPIYNYAYQKEYVLRKKRLSLLFYLLRLKLVNSILVQIYIARYRKMFRSVADGSDAIVLLCDGQVTEWRRMTGYNIEESQVAVIPNFIRDICDNSESNKGKSVLWVGKFDYSIKRPDLMLHIWSEVEEKHPEWVLLMLGDGPSLNEMKRLSQSLRLKNVVFPGRVDPMPYYRHAHIQCVTSVHEAFPMVPLESMIESNPVIAFNCYTSANYVIKDKENGFLIEPFDIQSYAKCLSCLLDDNQLRSKMGLSARESVSRFSADTVYSLWQQLFETL